MWKLALAGCLMMSLSSGAALAQEKSARPPSQIIDIEGPRLDLFDGKAGKRTESIPRERVLPLLPLKVLFVEANKRLKIQLPGKDGPVWVDKRQVRTDEPREAGACPGNTPEPPPKMASSMLASRGLGESCR